MHYQVPPHEEAKLVRCTRGRLYDVIIDLRSDSPTYKEHAGIELNEENRTMLYVPEGFAHGFLTLEDDTEVFYQMSEFYVKPRGACGGTTRPSTLTGPRLCGTSRIETSIIPILPSALMLFSWGI